jgi:hypothetical protein
MRNITYEINWKTGAVSGKITPARRVETLTGMTGNFDRREQRVMVRWKPGCVYPSEDDSASSIHGAVNKAGTPFSECEPPWVFWRFHCLSPFSMESSSE